MFDKRLLIQEVEELTDLLQNDDNWRYLHSLLLSKGLTVVEVLLAGFYEDENEHEYGVIVAPSLKIYEYRRETSQDAVGFLEWKLNDDINDLSDYYPAIAVAIEMMKSR